MRKNYDEEEKKTTMKDEKNYAREILILYLLRSKLLNLAMKTFV